MNHNLRILHLEDEPDYSHLIRDLLAREGLQVELLLVNTRAEFDAALAREKFDLILADYLLPSFTGIEALTLAQAKTPETPFLLVSGTIGEQAAIESLRSGATDYVLKQTPERLVPAVRRALEEARERAHRRRAETELIRREKNFRALTQNSLDIISLLNRQGEFRSNSPSVKRVLDYEPEELTGQSAFALIHPDDLPRVLEGFQYGLAHADQTVTLEFRFRHRNGAWVYLEAVGQSRLDDPAIGAVIINSRDITLRKHLEHQHNVLSNLGCNLSSVTAPQQAAEIIRDVADELFKWDALTLDLQLAGTGEALPLLNVDTIHGQRVKVETPGGPHPTSPLARRIAQNGAELLFSDDPARHLPDAVPFGDTTRPSATLMFAPIRVSSPSPPKCPPLPRSGTDGEEGLGGVGQNRRSKVIGILSIQSYTPRAYTEHDLETLQMLADHCGGALERIRAEQALRESEQRFRDLFEESPDAIFVEDAAGNVLDVNSAACRLHGIGRDQLIGTNVFDLVPAERRREVERDFRRLVDGETARVEGESACADGRVTPVEIHATPIEYRGQPAILLHVRDVSERKQTESALRSSEMLFHSVWENSVDGMRLTDGQGFIVAVNEAYCKLVGMTRTELEGKPFTVVYGESEQPGRILKNYQQAFRDRAIEHQIQPGLLSPSPPKYLTALSQIDPPLPEGQNERGTWGERAKFNLGGECHKILTLRNGNTIALENTNSFVELRGQPPMLMGSFRDVTAQKRLEDQLRQSQKMEAIGQLAGGVAHDFNNILTVIHGHASLLLGGGNLTGTATKSAQQIVQAADRAASLTRQLLTFSRRQVMQPRRLDLNDVVRNMTKMLGRILGEDIALELSYWPTQSPSPPKCPPLPRSGTTGEEGLGGEGHTVLPLVQADAGMLEQVLLNLAVNARDAMPRGGQLYIRISVEEVAGPQVSQHAEARPGRYVCLSTADSGCGIPPEILRRIFEPFFTTKEMGKGTGLGLATVYGIVKQHQGWIEVESELGHGTTFRVYLPLVVESAERKEDKPVEAAVRGGDETILVVEDERPVRELICNLLQGLGYRILEAESGVRALEVWRGHRDEIALLLTDVVMPDQINGRELAEKLWNERPDLKVIFTSGYSADAVGRAWLQRRGLQYVQKPYPPRHLAMAVRECLDAANLTPVI